MEPVTISRPPRPESTSYFSWPTVSLYKIFNRCAEYFVIDQVYSTVKKNLTEAPEYCALQINAHGNTVKIGVAACCLTLTLREGQEKLQKNIAHTILAIGAITGIIQHAKTYLQNTELLKDKADTDAQHQKTQQELDELKKSLATQTAAFNKIRDELRASVTSITKERDLLMKERTELTKVRDDLRVSITTISNERDSLFEQTAILTQQNFALKNSSAAISAASTKLEQTRADLVSVQTRLQETASQYELMLTRMNSFLDRATELQSAFQSSAIKIDTEALTSLLEEFRQMQNTGHTHLRTQTETPCIRVRR